MFTLDELRERSSLEYICSHYQDNEFRLFIECLFEEEDVDLIDIYVPDVHNAYEYCKEIHASITQAFQQAQQDILHVNDTPYRNAYQSLRAEYPENSEIKLMDRMCNGLLVGTLLMVLIVHRETLYAIEDSLRSIELALFEAPYVSPKDFQDRLYGCFDDISDVFRHIETEYELDHGSDTARISLHDGDRDYQFTFMRGNIH